MATDLDRLADLHFWLLSTMSSLVAVAGRDDAAWLFERVANYASRELLGRDMAECTDVELKALSDCLDELADAADFLSDVIEQACLLALQLRDASNAPAPEPSSLEGVSA